MAQIDHVISDCWCWFGKHLDCATSCSNDQKVEEVSLFINDALSDTSSVEYALKGLKGILQLGKGIEIMKETNERYHADKSEANVSIVGMYRLLKDSTIHCRSRSYK